MIKFAIVILLLFKVKLFARGIFFSLGDVRSPLKEKKIISRVPSRTTKAPDMPNAPGVCLAMTGAKPSVENRSTLARSTTRRHAQETIELEKRGV